MFKFAPYATVSDLQSQIYHKFKISNNLYWFSYCGKPLHFIKMDDLNGIVVINDRLLGGMQCCISAVAIMKWCLENVTMIGRFEINAVLIC